jgi:hypothetical protein
MNVKQHLAVAILILLPFYCIAQKTNSSIKETTKPIKKFNFVASAGIGFPSVLGYVLVKNANKDIVVIKSNNPFMAKLEYQRKRWGAGINYTTNFQQFHLIWPNTNPKLIDNNVFNTWSVGAKGNYYLINRSYKHKLKSLKWNDQLQVFVGGGVGYIETTQKTQTLNFPYPPTVTKTYGTFPMSFEITLGARYFINQHIGFFVETGLGNSPIQLIDKGISDSYVQGGLSIRF